MKKSLNKFSILIVLFVGFLFRLINLNQSLWLDEAITAIAVKNYSFLDLITKFSSGDFHPPLYYLVEKLWTVFFGYSEISLRMPSVIFGVLIVYFVYKIGGKKAGFLMAVNPLAIYYSQEARMYSMETFLVTAAVYYFIAKKKKLFTIFIVAAMYTDYLPWLMLPVFGTLWPIIFVLPLAPLLLSQLNIGQNINDSWGNLLGRLNLKNLMLVPVKFIFGRIPSSIIMAPVALVYGWVMIRSKNRVFWSWLVVPLIIGAVISIKIPVFSYFRFLFVLPAFILVLADGLRNNKIIFAFLVLVSVLSLGYFNLNPRFYREDWREAVKYINTDPGKITMPSMAQSAGLEYYGAKTDSQKSPVYLIRYVQEIFDPNDELRINLEKTGYSKIEEKSFNGVLIWKYSK